jgi:hypothetical protein
MHDENDERKGRSVTRRNEEDKIAELTPAQLGYMLIDNTASLHEQDPLVYRKLCATILDEVQAQSIFDHIDADDFAYNLTTENLFRRAIMATLGKAKKSFANTTITTKEELRGELISGPALETLHKLSKLEDNYGRNRRAIGNGLRARAESRKRLTSAPVQSFPVGEEPPPLAPDYGQADEAVN